ncbi:MAG TPA: hypothetical protein VH988_11730 [Thermoanaerobaculia bacterium]|jgi:hypothetical protein|nr:hypothetical protein [Thermoanaerobaculia bacterium]
MKDEAPLLSNGLVDDEQDEWTTGTLDAAPRLAPPPATCEEVLAAIGAVKKAVYVLVRHCVDELEKAAPWELLYYPSEDPGALLAMVGGLITAIKGVPKKIDMLLRKLPAGDTGKGEPAREDIGFLFHGIHRMVAHDIKRLEGILAPVVDRGAELPPGADEKQRLCELSADLKGKYSSALMGAAASLIGEGMWNSVELEPVLFPEKAEEFRCTRDLVVSLHDAVAAIRQLPEQIPFDALLERWRRQVRVDQYALADLPSLRGKIGRLLKERSRRALYSGDYHQISRREVLLSQRINELERLHQQTWAVPPPADLAPDLTPIFARLVQLTFEVAAVLDANILKALIGEKKVNGLRGRAASLPKGQPPRTAAADGPGGLDDLAPLLAEDDLRIFFEMLLTAVQRRASLSVQEPDPPAPPPLPTPPAPKPPKPLPAPPPATPPPIDPRLVLARLDAALGELQSPANQQWNSFRMTQRLLEKHSRLPSAMFHAVNPFLQEITNRLIPDLKAIAPYKGLTLEAVQRLETVCRELCQENPSPAQLADEVPRKLDRIVHFLDALRGLVQ